jgi:tRNA A-37 threonylcarbamoyl transferase component Bud32
MDTIDSEVDNTRPSSNRDGGASDAPFLLYNQFAPDDVIDDRYRIISILGRGGCGCVYKVVQMSLKKQFALKTLNPINTTEITTLRLHKEAQAASRLEHPNLVRAVDFGMINGTQPFLVMDLVEGPTLSQYLKTHGRASLSTALEIFLPLCDALAYAHVQGVVHRDLKPSNVILAPDESGGHHFVPKVVDFGIAKLKSFEATKAMTLTATGDIFGTPLYMSPEQCMGTGVDGRSDIYALGCMLFETLTGAPPFGGTNALEVMMKHGAGTIPSLKEASLGETFPAALERVIRRMLAKEPDNRYQDCSAVAADLEAVSRGDFAEISDSPEAITLRQQRREQISSSLIYALIGIIGGATIGYCAHQYLSPTPAPAPALAPQAKPEAEGTGFYNLVTGFSYFSKIVGKKRVFEFSTSHKHSLGDIYWWQSGKLKHVPCLKTQEVPKDAQLIFKIASEMLVAPDLWPRFRPSEFNGVFVELHSCYVEDDPLNQSIREITQQQALKILILEMKSISAKTFLGISGLSHLRWLDVRDIIADEQRLTGKVVSHLLNLQNLRVLRLEKVLSVSPVLSQLTNNNSLRRLSLAGDYLTAEEIKLIPAIKSIEVLSLRSNDLSKLSIKPWDELVKLPNLKYVVVESGVLSDTDPQTLEKLRGLTILTNNTALPANIQDAIAKNKSIKLIQDGDLMKRDGDWFDPLKNDPKSLID